MEFGLMPECGNIVQTLPLRPLKDRCGIPDQEHPVLKYTAILAKKMKKSICLNRPYIQKYIIHQHEPYGCHPLPYIRNEISNPKPHSFMTLLPCKVYPSKTALSLHKCPFLHGSAVDLVKVDPVHML